MELSEPTSQKKQELEPPKEITCELKIESHDHSLRSAEVKIYLKDIPRPLCFKLKETCKTENKTFYLTYEYSYECRGVRHFKTKFDGQTSIVSLTSIDGSYELARTQLLNNRSGFLLCKDINGVERSINNNDILYTEWKEKGYLGIKYQSAYIKTPKVVTTDDYQHFNGSVPRHLSLI